MLAARTLLCMSVCAVALRGTCALAEPAAREITFQGAGGTKIAGTLLLPDAKPATPVPALVLVAGSGPTNRDGNQPPQLVTDLLAQVADALARHGVASLRYDKRGMHANVGDLPANKADYGEFFSWEYFVGDVRAASAFLCGQPEIDSRRVGILGHSEGGVLALVVGSSPEPAVRPAAIVLLNTPGRPLDLVVHDQLERLLARQRAAPAQVKYFLDENTRIVQAIKTTGKVPADVPPGLRALYPAYIGKFLQSDFAADPAKLAAQYGGPVLLVAAEKDVQVSPERDARLLDAALAARPTDDHKFILAPAASHNLKPVKEDAEPGLTGQVAPELLDQISAWASAKLGGK